MEEVVLACIILESSVGTFQQWLVACGFPPQPLAAKFWGLTAALNAIMMEVPYDDDIGETVVWLCFSTLQVTLSMANSRGSIGTHQQKIEIIATGETSPAIGPFHFFDVTRR